MFNGKINYKWAIFNSYVKLPEGIIDVTISILTAHAFQRSPEGHYQEITWAESVTNILGHSEGFAAAL